MAHFAEIDENNIVLRVIIISNDDAPDPTPEASEPSGQSYIASLGIPGTWKQTSYTSRAGNRINPETGEVLELGNHFRYNYAGIGFTFDSDFGDYGAFIPPQPFSSWTLNPETAVWDPPIPYPDNGAWEWDEETFSWIEFTI